MFWMMFAQAAASASKQYLASSVTKATNAALQRTEAATAAAGNKTRAAANLLEAAKGSLARFSQSVNNNRMLEAMGSSLEAGQVNARRQDDALLRSGFENTLRAAEEEGGQAAQRAWTGLSSSVTTQVNAATALRRSRALADATSLRSTLNFDSAKRASQIVSQSIRGLDSSVILPSLDYNTDVGREYGKVNPWIDALRAGASAALSQSENLQSERTQIPQTDNPTYRFDTSKVSFGERNVNSIRLGGSTETTSDFWGKAPSFSTTESFSSSSSGSAPSSIYSLFGNG